MTIWVLYLTCALVVVLVAVAVVLVAGLCRAGSREPRDESFEEWQRDCEDDAWFAERYG